MAITPLLSRVEEILAGSNVTPMSRIEVLLVELINYIETGLSSVFHYRGSVQAYSDLSSITNPEVGDVYNVIADGMDYAWTGEAWDSLGTLVIVASEITSDGQAPVTSQAIYNALATKVDKINGKGLSTNDFTDDLLQKLTGIVAPAIGTCTTAGSVAEKVVTMPQGWTLHEGAVIAVRFSYSNSTSVDNVALNVGGSGAKSIYYSGAVYTGHSSQVCGYANHYIYYVYDGTYWVWMGWDFMPVTSTLTQEQINAGTDTVGKLITAKLLCDNFAKISSLAGKQDTLTTAQQAAVDSGITSAKVGQYDKDSAALPSVVDGGAKNLFRSEVQSTTAGGVEFTVNSDGTYTLNGTATTSTWFVLSEGNTIKAGSYVLTSGVDLGNSAIAIISPSRSTSEAIMRSDTNPTATFTTDQTGMLFAVRVQNGASLSNVVVKPMLCTAADYEVSPAFEPYALPNAPITSELIDLVNSSAKNYINSAGVLTSGTVGGIAYTINTDGSVAVAGGTATSNSDLVVDLVLTAGVEYVLSGCLDGGGGTTYKAQVVRGSALTEVVNVQSSTASAAFTPTAGETYKWRFRVYNGKSVPSGTFYPMICTKVVWDISRKYVPYAPALGTWEEYECFYVSGAGSYFDSTASSVKVKVNRALKRCVADMSLTTIAEMTTSTAAFNFGTLVDIPNRMEIRPVATSRTLVVSKAYDYTAVISKASTNSTISFFVLSGTIASGTSFECQLSWDFV